jgi:flagellar biosynthesis regulator FlaF
MSKNMLHINDTVNFAKTAYSDNKTAIDCSVLSYCISVAKIAEEIAQRLFRDMRSDAVPPDRNDIIESIVHAATLSETISVARCTFEHVAAISNVQIASMVATLTRDHRLVETKRDIEYRGRLSNSPLSAQIVAMAAIVCSANGALKFLQKNGIAVVPKIRKMLAQLDGDLLSIHAVSRYYTLRLYAHAARNLIIDANQLIKKLKAEARTSRLVEKNTAGIRKRHAAKQATVIKSNEE